MIDCLMKLEFTYAALSLLIYIFSAFSLCATFYFAGNWLHKIELNIIKDLYNDLLTSIYYIETKKFAEKSVSEYLLYFRDLEKIGAYIFGLFYECSNFLKLIITYTVILAFSKETCVILLSISIINFIIAKKLFNRLNKITKVKLKEEINYLTSQKDNIEGTREVIVYRCHDWINQHIKNAFNHVLNVVKNYLEVENKKIIFSELFRWMIVICCLFYNGYQVTLGQLTVGGLVVIYQLGLSYSSFYYKFYEFMIGLSDNFALIERVNWIADSRIKIDHARGDLELDKKGIYLKNVSFQYPDSHRAVIQHSNIYIPPQKTTVICGNSGCGKSTVIGLLTKQLSPTEGTLYFGNQNILDVSEQDILKYISIVFQQPLMINGTVKDNILLGNDKVSWEKVVNVCKEIKIYDTIMAFPSEFETIIGDKGLTISGGERQRIAIVRALLQDKEIIILDEATSALDLETEREVMNNFFILRKNKTNIIIAHRKYSQKNAFVKYQIIEGYVKNVPVRVCHYGHPDNACPTGGRTSCEKV